MIQTQDFIFSIALLENYLDGNLLASGHKNGAIHIWDITTLRNTKTYLEHTSYVDDLKYIHDNIFISCGKDKFIKVWDITLDKSILTILNESWIYIITQLKNYNNSYIVSGDDKKFINIWNYTNGDKISDIQTDHKNVVGRLLHLSEISPYNLLISTSNPDVKLWDLDSKKCIRAFLEHTDWVNAIVYLKDDLFLTGSGDKTIKMWSIKSPSSLRTFNVHKSYVACLLSLKEYVEDDVILTGSLGKSSKIVELNSGKLIKTFERTEGIFKMVPIYKNNALKVVGCHWGSKNIKIWGKKFEIKQT